jgi:hypothetical protein
MSEIFMCIGLIVIITCVIMNFFEGSSLAYKNQKHQHELEKMKENAKNEHIKETRRANMKCEDENQKFMHQLLEEISGLHKDLKHSQQNMVSVLQTQQTGAGMGALSLQNQNIMTKLNVMDYCSKLDPKFMTFDKCIDFSIGSSITQMTKVHIISEENNEKHQTAVVAK